MNAKRKPNPASAARAAEAEPVAAVMPEAPAPRPRNPHCAPLWPATAYTRPRMVDRYMLAALRLDMTAITTLADLLAADDDIATTRADSDTPDDEPVPFALLFHHGLQCALRSCADNAARKLEWLDDSAFEGRARDEAAWLASMNRAT